MKLATLLAFTVTTAVVAAPAGEEGLVTRQNDVTDQILFSITLPAFTTRRNAKNPPTLDWSSDNCSWSPDNPLGFPFEPGCNRHDFGYRNYKKQTRFTTANKLKIDNNFKKDDAFLSLYYQCRNQSLKSVCEALANVYYEVVRRVGKQAASSLVNAKLDDDSSAYDAAVAKYEEELKKARERGDLPAE
ncbi:unnamed protein product [Clonostachys rhizophaga]|uniref:Secretory phospholipase A2 n=1 Tax=Clonostachys rhizophaga TaxID=160324 RepID=A0A9N9VCF8_9HYPO|nr:unnamed protein product [Clonostachys rhizophaga]